jgi:hypothetical protein
MSEGQPVAPDGWYPSPSEPGQFRYFASGKWTDATGTEEPIAGLPAWTADPLQGDRLRYWTGDLWSDSVISVSEAPPMKLSFDEEEMSQPHEVRSSRGWTRSQFSIVLVAAVVVLSVCGYLAAHNLGRPSGESTDARSQSRSGETYKRTYATYEGHIEVMVSQTVSCVSDTLCIGGGPQCDELADNLKLNITDDEGYREPSPQIDLDIGGSSAGKGDTPHYLCELSYLATVGFDGPSQQMDFELVASGSVVDSAYSVGRSSDAPSFSISASCLTANCVFS